MLALLAPSSRNILRYFSVFFFILCAGLGVFFSVLVNQPPVISYIQNENAGLAGLLRVNTSFPSYVEVKVEDGKDSWIVPIETDRQTSHAIPILGLKPDTKHIITISAGSIMKGILGSSAVLELTTQPLPPDFPPLDIQVSRPDKMEKGITMFNVYNWTGGLQNGYGLILGVNENGEVVWYFRDDHRINEVSRTANGNLLYTKSKGNYAIVEIDMLGNVLNEWHPTGVNSKIPENVIPVDTDKFHHHVQELPSGNILSMSTEVREYKDYYTSTENKDDSREDAYLVGDVIVEFDRDGTIVHEWKLLDMIDPYRIGYGSLDGFQNGKGYGNIDGGTKDWSHGNAAEYVEEDDSILISLRHQDAVIKIGREDGEIRWILGPHKGWTEPWEKYLLTPKGDLEWQYHQHAPVYTEHGTILMFDNGNFRQLPFQEKNPEESTYSRAVEYKVDEENMTVEQVWEYDGMNNDQFYSGALSDADPMPQTGNVLITDGFRFIDNVRAGRIVEVTYDEPVEKVFELLLYDGEGNWNIYRADRWPSLY